MDKYVVSIQFGRLASIDQMIAEGHLWKKYSLAALYNQFTWWNSAMYRASRKWIKQTARIGQENGNMLVEGSLTRSFLLLLSLPKWLSSGEIHSARYNPSTMCIQGNTGNRKRYSLCGLKLKQANEHSDAINISLEKQNKQHRNLHKLIYTYVEPLSLVLTSKTTSRIWLTYTSMTHTSNIQYQLIVLDCQTLLNTSFIWQNSCMFFCNDWCSLLMFFCRNEK